MGHSNSKSGGYRPLAPQGRPLTRDEWLVHTGMTQEEWIAKQHSTYDCLRSVPDDYVGPWDRAAAMAAVHTGRCAARRTNVCSFLALSWVRLFYSLRDYGSRLGQVFLSPFAILIDLSNLCWRARDLQGRTQCASARRSRHSPVASRSGGGQRLLAQDQERLISRATDVCACPLFVDPFPDMQETAQRIPSLLFGSQASFFLRLATIGWKNGIE
nr:hypothetical protein [Pandoravirus aubagnensis]